MLSSRPPNLRFHTLLLKGLPGLYFSSSVSISFGRQSRGRTRTDHPRAHSIYAFSQGKKNHSILKYSSDHADSIATVSMIVPTHTNNWRGFLNRGIAGLGYLVEWPLNAVGVNGIRGT